MAFTVAGYQFLGPFFRGLACTPQGPGILAVVEVTPQGNDVMELHDTENLRDLAVELGPTLPERRHRAGVPVVAVLELGFQEERKRAMARLRPLIARW